MTPDTETTAVPWPPLVRFVLYAVGLGVLGDLALHRIPAESGLALFGEYGRLETIQVALIAVGLLIALVTAVQRPASRPISILLAGMLVAILVREHNNYFKDHHFRGLWQLLVAAIVGTTIAIAWRWRARFVPALRTLISRPAFGWMAAGVLVATYAQMLDERSLWQLILEQEDFPYAARRMGEESLEVAAFYIFTVGLLEYRLTLPHAAEDSA